MPTYASSSKFSQEASVLPAHSKTAKTGSNPATSQEAKTTANQLEPETTTEKPWGMIAANVIQSAAGETLRGRNGLVVQRKMTLGEVGDRDLSHQSESDEAPPILRKAPNLTVHASNRFMVQPKLTIGAVGDNSEQDAERLESSQVSLGSTTGLPDTLKAGIETLSGIAMDSVKVHHNSTKPAQLQALAYTEGTEIHLGPGQEKHLPHEAWHVVQQLQQRVEPKGTIARDGKKQVGINCDPSLEREADIWGAHSVNISPDNTALSLSHPKVPGLGVVQGMLTDESDEEEVEDMDDGGEKDVDGMETEEKIEVEEKTVSDEKKESKKRKKSADNEGNDEEGAEEGNERPNKTSKTTEGVAAQDLNSQKANETESMEEEVAPLDEEELEPMEEDLEQVFWARAVLRVIEPEGEGKSKSTYDINNFSVASVSISPERRTTARGKDQGDHLVAWSAMYRYWNSQLRGSLKDVLERLQGWIVADQIADADSQGINTKNRASALYFIRELQSKEFTANNVLRYLETAISLFVEANQASSFAVHGNASGGKDEGNAQKELKRLNTLVNEEDLPLEKVESEVSSYARALIDVQKKDLTEMTLSKVVYTWYKMLKETYPKLESCFNKQEFLTYKIHSGKSVNDLINIWKDTYYEQGMEDAKNKLSLAVIAKTPREATTGVWVNVESKQQGNLKASEVEFKYLELPATIRAKTRFGATQGSHTIAWTYERASLMAMFKDKKGNEILDLLGELAERDKKSFDLGESYLTQLKNSEEKARAEKLSSEIATLKASVKLQPLHKWIAGINKLILEYIEVNQVLPTTTYKAAGQAYSHGEAAANKAFTDERLTPGTYQSDVLVNYAAKYIDIGIIYLPLIQDLTAYRELIVRDDHDPIRDHFSKDGDRKASAARELVKAKKSQPAKGPGQYILTDGEEKKLQEVITRLVGIKTYGKRDYKEAIKELDRFTIEQYSRFFQDTRIIMGQIEEARGEGWEDPTMDVVEAIRTRVPVFSKLDTEAQDTIGAFQTRIVRMITDVRARRKQSVAWKTAQQGRAAVLLARLATPEDYIVQLYADERGVLEKIFGDFYRHLRRFDRSLYDAMSVDHKLREQLLTTVLSAPLNPSDVVVGDAIKSQLPEIHKAYVVQLKAAITKHASIWAKELMP